MAAHDIELKEVPGHAGYFTVECHACPWAADPSPKAEAEDSATWHRAHGDDPPQPSDET